MKVTPRGVLGIVLSALFLYWALHDIEFAEVWRNIRASNIPMLLFAALVALGIFPLRALRWRPILHPVEPNLPLGPLWRATCIGMMVNNVVPARAGELARAYALKRELPRIPFSAAFASLAVDRLFDALVIVLLLLLSMLDPAFPGATRIAGQPIANWAGTGVIIAVVLFGLLYAIVLFPARLISLYEAFAQRVAPRFEQQGRDALQAFAAGLGALRSPRRFAEVFGWTLAHWLVSTLGMWIGFKSVGIDVPFSAALFVQCLICLAVALPAAPGFFGVFELIGKEGLGVYKVPETLAVTWAISYHIVAFIPITLIGAWYFIRMGMHFTELQRAQTADDDPVVR